MSVVIISCINPSISYIVDDDSVGPLVADNVYYVEFDGGGSPQPGCYTVGPASVLEPEFVLGSAVLYNSCLDCFQDQNYSISFSSCTNPDLIVIVSSYQFTSSPFGLTHILCDESGEQFEGCLCFEPFDVSFAETPYSLTLSDKFENCETCEASFGSTPISAGTEYFVCQICEGESGYTATQVTVPHPTWSRPDGREVIQMSAVQLGGMFGLNS